MQPDITLLQQIWPDYEIVSHVPDCRGAELFSAVLKGGASQNNENNASIRVLKIPQEGTDTARLAARFNGEAEMQNFLQSAASRYMSQLQTMKNLNGTPGIAAVKDCRWYKTADGRGWVICALTERLTPLSAVFRDRPCNEDEAAKLGSDICNAVGECNKRGINLLDFRPECIYRDSNGNYKLADLGAGRMVAAASGTDEENYMPPEANSGGKRDNTWDTYSTGLVLYKLLNGNRIPFVQKGRENDPESIKTAQMRRLRGEQLPALENVSPGMNSVLLNACSPDPGRRYSDPDKMREALENRNRSAAAAYASQANEKPFDPDSTVIMGAGAAYAAGGAFAAPKAFDGDSTVTVNHASQRPSDSMRPNAPYSAARTNAGEQQYGTAQPYAGQMPYYAGQTEPVKQYAPRAEEAAVPQQQNEDNNDEKPKKEKKGGALKIIAIILAILLIIAMLGVAGIYAYRLLSEKDDDDNDETDNSDKDALTTHVPNPYDDDEATPEPTNAVETNTPYPTDSTSTAVPTTEEPVVTEVPTETPTASIPDPTLVQNSNLGFDIGRDHVIGLRSGGSCVAAGDNSNGKCNVNGWSGVIQVAAGYDTSFGLTQDGRVLMAGSDSAIDYGTVTGWRDIVQISAHARTIMALDRYGNVYISGKPDREELGAYSIQQNIKSRNGADPVLVSAGRDHVLILFADGTCAAFGYSGAGNNDDTGRLAVQDWTDIIYATTCQAGSMGIRRDGSIVYTGGYKHNQNAVTSMRYGDFRTISSKGYSFVYIDSNGRVNYKGTNDFEAQGIEAWNNYSSKHVVAVVCSRWNIAALFSDGSVEIIGDENNANGCRDGLNNWPRDIVPRR